MEKNPLEKENARTDRSYDPMVRSGATFFSNSFRYSSLGVASSIQGTRILGGGRGMLFDSCGISYYIQDCRYIFEGVTT